MTNELGLELDKQAQYDVTKEEVLESMVEIECFIAINLLEKHQMHLQGEVDKIRQYIEERP